MRTQDLKTMDVKSLRRMARASGLPLNRKIDIINALADDSVGLVYRSADRLKALVREVLAEDGVLSSKNGNSSSPVGLVPEDDDTFVRWPEVSPAEISHPLFLNLVFAFFPLQLLFLLCLLNGIKNKLCCQYSMH